MLRHSGEPWRVRAHGAKVDAAVWMSLVEMFSDADLLRSALERHEKDLRTADPGRIEELRTQTRKLKSKADYALSLMVDPDLADDLPQIKEQHRALGNERRRLEAEISSLEQALGNQLSVGEWIEETVSVVSHYLQTLGEAEKRQEFVRRLVNRAEWNGEEIRMQVFVDPELTTTSGHSGQFHRAQVVVTARVA